MTEYLYDWRNRLQYVVLPPDGGDRVTYTAYGYDNLNRVVQVRAYFDDDSDLASVGPETYSTGAAAEDELVAQTATAYDNMGQVYAVSVYAVGPIEDQGQTYVRPGDSLAAAFWYDAAGNLVKSQGAHDGLCAGEGLPRDGTGRGALGEVGG